jgi:hypothetical protein
MKDEIIAGMKNALARGQNLEQAAKSFVNAGYNPQEVKAAYESMSSGISVVDNGPINTMSLQSNGQNSPPINSSPRKILPVDIQPVKKKSKMTLLITVISAAVLILLGALGYLFYVLYMK